MNGKNVVSFFLEVEADDSLKRVVRVTGLSAGFPVGRGDELQGDVLRGRLHFSNDADAGD
jgi:hypothetical protein